MKAPRTGNFILDHLASAEFESLASRFDHLDLDLGNEVHDPYDPPRSVFFPTAGVISLMLLLEDGHTSELAVVGREGVVGVSVFLGGTVPPTRARVQVDASVIRLPASVLLTHFRRMGSLQLHLLRYTQALLSQVSQTAMCNRHHSIDQQLCRWLLLSLDRVEGDTVVMTQELIADMLGVRREGVSLAAGKLQRDGLISYSRGRISVLARDGLAERACECYETVEKEYQRYYAGTSCE